MMDISEIRTLTNDDMKIVNQRIIKELYSDIELIEIIGHYIIENGGKRFRPLMTLLSAKALNCQNTLYYDLAVIIEFIHTATLLHDDVVDESDLRRSKKTANNIWGNAESVLVGDFLYSRAFEMMVSSEKMAVMKVMAKATNKIAEGEVLQLLNCHDPETTEQTYFEVIERKTATLFSAATQLGGIAADANETQLKGLTDFGHYLGIAFQILDDLIDYSDQDVDIGKNIGDDLSEGKPTLPLIRALKMATPTQKSRLEKAIISGNIEMIDEVIEIIKSTDAIEYTRLKATEITHKACQALEVLPDTPYRDALIGLAQHGLKRTY